VLSAVALPLAAATMVGCSDDGDSKGYDRTAWDTEALAELDELAAKVQATDIGCTDYGPDGFEIMRESFKAVDQPVPAASTSCASNDDENLTFEAFASSKAKDRFVEAKAALLCERLRPLDEGVTFVGLPYLDGGEWMVTPDSAAMRDRLQPIVGGEPKNMREGGA
jgi:hypothetical protein